MAEPRVTTQAVHVSAGSNLPIRRIVIHATCPMLGFPRASAAGQAKGTARYFTDTAAGGSAHYVEDVAAEEHCVADSRIAWHAPPNPHSIGIEICADGGSAAAYRKASTKNYTREQWLSPRVWPAVQRAARRARDLCDRFDIPKTQLTAAEVRADESGICGHADVSAAFGMTDHSDPGPNFPWVEFMREVVGTQSEEDDMQLTDTLYNPITKEKATVGQFLQSINSNAYAARKDAAVARSLAEAAAKAGKPLTASEIDDIAAATVAALNADYDATVTLTKKEPA